MQNKKPQIDIVIPIYNEEVELEDNITKLHTFLGTYKTDYSFSIVIADNASTDQSGAIGKKLSKKFPTVSYIYLDKKGRGRAVKKVWSTSDADFVAYMDVDLSTDLNHFPSLIKALQEGADIAIGSRLLKQSKVDKRPLKREILSRGYNFMIKLLFNSSFSDAQCGFKAINRRAKNDLLPLIKDNEWFFDSELLIVGEKAGFKIKEVPVVWVDNPGSTVRVLKTVSGDLYGLWRLFSTQPWRRLHNPITNLRKVK